MDLGQLHPESEWRSIRGTSLAKQRQPQAELDLAAELLTGRSSGSDQQHEVRSRGCGQKIHRLPGAEGPRRAEDRAALTVLTPAAETAYIRAVRTCISLPVG